MCGEPLLRRPLGVCTALCVFVYLAFAFSAPSCPGSEERRSRRAVIKSYWRRPSRLTWCFFPDGKWLSLSPRLGTFSASRARGNQQARARAQLTPGERLQEETFSPVAVVARPLSALGRICALKP